MELNNPLRKTMRPLPPQDMPKEVLAVPKEIPVQVMPIATSVVREEKAIAQAQTALVSTLAAGAKAIAPKVTKTFVATPAVALAAPMARNPDMVEDPAIKAAMALLARNGIELAAPKKTYVKHSYEIEEDLHTEFHEMYSVLGFKQVKAAMNDALRLWCKTNKAEYSRRKG